MTRNHCRAAFAIIVVSGCHDFSYQSEASAGAAGTAGTAEQTKNAGGSAAAGGSQSAGRSRGGTGGTDGSPIGGFRSSGAGGESASGSPGQQSGGSEAVATAGKSGDAGRGGTTGGVVIGETGGRANLDAGAGGEAPIAGQQGHTGGIAIGGASTGGNSGGSTNTGGAGTAGASTGGTSGGSTNTGGAGTAGASTGGTSGGSTSSGGTAGGGSGSGGTSSNHRYIVSHFWSPDGSRIAYSQCDPARGSCECDLVVSDPLLTSPVRVRSDLEAVGVLDWQNDWILFRKRSCADDGAAYDGSYELYKVRADGSGLTQLTFTRTNGIATSTADTENRNRGTVIDGRFLPSQGLVYYRAHDGNGWYSSYTSHDDGTDQWVLISSIYTRAIGASRTGNTVGYGLAANYGLPYDLLVAGPDGSDVVEVASQLDHRSSFCLSPDGSTVVYASGGTSQDLILVDSDGTNRRELLVGESDDRLNGWVENGPMDERCIGAFSPDGKRIVFTSDRSGYQHVYEIGLDGSGLRQLSDGEYYDQNPRYSPDGRYVSFLRVPAAHGDRPWPVELGLVPLWTTLVSDGFESYTAGSYPSAGGWTELWSGAATSQVVDDVSHEGEQALRLTGTPGWTRADGITLDLGQPSRLAYSYSVMIPDGSAAGTYAGFFVRLSGSQSQTVNAVVFPIGSSRMIQVIGDSAQSTGQVWEFDTWYEVRVEIDYADRIMTAYIDGTQVAQVTPQPVDTSNVFSLETEWTGSGSGQAIVYYDDVRIEVAR